MIGLETIQSPFVRLRELLGDIEPGAEPIDMTIGEPGHMMPQFLSARLAEDTASYAHYPQIIGTPEFRSSVVAWHGRRYGITLDPDTEVCVLCGSREGLASAILTALIDRRREGRDKILMPNPFYQCYAAATIAGGGTPVYLSVDAATGHLPDLAKLEGDRETLARAAAVVLCSPANPQGAVADENYLARLISLCRNAGAMLFVDECYSEVYTDVPPAGALQVAQNMTGSRAGVVAFNSLSKRSNVPGLRSGFAAGDAQFMARMTRFRNVSAPQVAMPVQHASAALWNDEVHVDDSRALYRRKFDLADDVLADRFGYRRPGGGFFLWLDMEHLGGGEAAAVTLWKAYGVKLLPGAYLSQLDGEGRNPGAQYVRAALVHDLETTETALRRIIAT